MIYETIYKQLKDLFNGTFPEEYQKRQVGGLMDLNIDVLYSDNDEILIALAHNFNQGGDVLCDPDMQIKIYPLTKMAEAITYQDAMGFREVYPHIQKGDDWVKMINSKAKKDLNSFLSQWLKNLKVQGFFNQNTIVMEKTTT